MNPNEMIEAVREAFAPGADEETKRHGAAILRGALNLLEPPPPPVAATQMPTTTAPHGPPPDVLSLIIERLSSLVPAEKLKTVPGLHITLIDFGTSTRRP